MYCLKIRFVNLKDVVSVHKYLQLTKSNFLQYSERKESLEIGLKIDQRCWINVFLFFYLHSKGFVCFLTQVDSSETLSDSDTEGKALTEVHSIGVQVEDDKR